VRREHGVTREKLYVLKNRKGGMHQTASIQEGRERRELLCPFMSAGEKTP
jgi:hypothetical protein